MKVERESDVVGSPSVTDQQQKATVTNLIAEHAIDAIFLLDAEGCTTYANPAAEAMFGWPEAELLGKKLHDLIHYRHPDGTAFPMCDCPLGQVFATGESLRQHQDLFYHRDGREVPVSCSNAAILEDGSVVGGVIIVRDVTDTREAERRRQLMVKELHHRVKNTLAVVQSIAHQSFDGEHAEACRTAFDGRLNALAAANDLLADDEWRAGSIEDVVRRALLPFCVSDDCLSLTGPQVLLPPAACQTLSLAMHELATNAVKYGAFSTPTGRVDIEWRIEGGKSEPALFFCWIESGGPTVVEPVRRGFGTRMIESGLASELRAQVTCQFLPGGFVCTLRGPLPDTEA